MERRALWGTGGGLLVPHGRSDWPVRLPAAADSTHDVPGGGGPRGLWVQRFTPQRGNSAWRFSLLKVRVLTSMKSLLPLRRKKTNFKAKLVGSELMYFLI